MISFTVIGRLNNCISSSSSTLIRLCIMFGWQDELAIEIMRLCFFTFAYCFFLFFSFFCFLFFSVACMLRPTSPVRSHMHDVSSMLGLTMNSLCSTMLCGWCTAGDAARGVLVMRRDVLFLFFLFFFISVIFYFLFFIAVHSHLRDAPYMLELSLRSLCTNNDLAVLHDIFPTFHTAPVA